MGKSILLVGCSTNLKRTLAASLPVAEYWVEALADLRDPRYEEQVSAAELILLHEQATGASLAHVCRCLRRVTRRPLLVWLQEVSQSKIVEALACGADDCLTPQISEAELVARLRAHLRRDAEYSQEDQAARYECAELVLDAGRREVRVRGELVSLTPKEFDLAHCLIQAADRAVRREELLANVWGFTEALNTRTLDVHIGRLRQKIEADPTHPELIITVPGVGYRLAAA